ncbi:MAG: asparaginase [Gemmatimonadota bacterium]
MSNRVAVLRGSVEESSHAVHVAVADAEGRHLWGAGDPSRVTFFRSSAKPIQALPLVEDGVCARFGLESSDLAICCASHGGEPVHVRRVAGLLDRIDLTEDALECGPQVPMHAASAERLIAQGATPGRIHNNCSGKHAGMLALARYHGWPTAGYSEAAHPVQQRMWAEVARWTGRSREDIEVAVDGCGVSCFALPVLDMARAYARFADAARRGEPAASVVEAMTAHPYEVAGSGRLCTALMERTGARLFAKVGAEGVYGAGLPESGVGIAVKVEDGGWRAAGVALLAVLETLGALSEDDRAALAEHARPLVRNTRDWVVGRIESKVDLRRLHD